MNKRPNSLHEADKAHTLHPYTNMRLHEDIGPMIMERGDGIRVYDTEGKSYIEGLAGLWSVAVGFSETRLRDAAMRQMDQLSYYHTFAHKANVPAIQLAEKLAEMTPDGFNRAFFTNSGSEANDTVIKMLWFLNNGRGKPEKKKMLARTKGYHGITIASGSLTGLPGNHKDFDLPAIPVTHLSTPHYWKCAEPGESEADFTARLLKELEDVIAEEGADTIAGFIGEPVMGAGGVMTPPAGYWEGVEKICRANDILLISDEVINGFGRLGTPFGFQKYGFTPDIFVISKQLTSSYMPLAAIMMNDAVYDMIADNTAKLGTFGHGFTGSGHPVACAVGVENLSIIQEKDLMGNAARMEVPFQKAVQALSDHPLVGEARGTGLIAGLEMGDKETRTSFGAPGQVAAMVIKMATEEGLILRNVYDTVALCPPLILTEDNITEIFDKLKIALDRAYDWAKSEGLL